MTDTAQPPYFNIADPSFVIDSEEVLAAREESWYVRTNYGLAVLRYDEVSALLKDRRLKQGSAAWPAHHGVTGPFADWWSRALLNLEGDDHARIRRLLNPAFAPGAISDLRPRFQDSGQRARGRLRGRGPLRVHEPVRRALRGARDRDPARHPGKRVGEDR